MLSTFLTKATTILVCQTKKTTVISIVLWSVSTSFGSSKSFSLSKRLRTRHSSTSKRSTRHLTSKSLATYLNSSRNLSNSCQNSFQTTTNSMTLWVSAVLFSRKSRHSHRFQHLLRICSNFTTKSWLCVQTATNHPVRKPQKPTLSYLLRNKSKPGRIPFLWWIWSSNHNNYLRQYFKRVKIENNFKC